MRTRKGRDQTVVLTVELDGLAAGAVAELVGPQPPADAPAGRGTAAAGARPGLRPAELRLVIPRGRRGVAALEGRLEHLVHLAAVVPGSRRRREGGVDAPHEARELARFVSLLPAGGRGEANEGRWFGLCVSGSLRFVHTRTT